MHRRNCDRSCATHSAIGVAVATAPLIGATAEAPEGSANTVQQKLAARGSPVVSLACAHWAKFPQVQSQAAALGVTGEALAALSHEALTVPAVLAGLDALPERCVVRSSEFDDVRAYIMGTLVERALISADAAGVAK